jgi:hypothetical protein
VRRQASLSHPCGPAAPPYAPGYHYTPSQFQYTGCHGPSVVQRLQLLACRVLSTLSRSSRARWPVWCLTSGKHMLVDAFNTCSWDPLMSSER